MGKMVYQMNTTRGPEPVRGHGPVTHGTAHAGRGALGIAAGQWGEIVHMLYGTVVW